MQFRSKFNVLCVVALAGLVLLPSVASAAKIQYILDTSVAGQFKVFAQSDPSGGAHGGIATYGIPLVGATTISHVSPAAGLASNAANPPAFGPAGFTEVRSLADVTPIAAGQNVVTPTPHLIYGFGQEANSFEGLGLTPVGPPPTGPTWEAKLLIAEGTHGGTIDFDRENVNLLADVFMAAGNPQLTAAELQLCINTCGGGGNPPVIVPVNLGDTALAVINQQLNATGDGPITWSNLVSSGPGNPVNAATLSPTGAFEWHTLGSARPGSYSWTATATNEFGSDTDVAISLNLIVPEPATLSLVGLAMIGFVGFVGRRGR
jgi:hypothetical protein